MDGPRTARRMWRLLEPVHAVTYFAPESVEALKAVGLKGFWMAYFAGRSAPMGRVGAATVSASFYNFAPFLVDRAIPDAWGFAEPAEVLGARLAGVDLALRRLLGPLADGPEVAEAAELAWEASRSAVCDGRVLAAANQALPRPDDPLLALWQAATTLREHRGDGHLTSLVNAGLDGRQAHVTLVASGAIPRTTLQAARGWTDGEWAEAEEALIERGWLDGDGAFTPTGSEARATVEADTDRLAAGPWEALGEAACDRLAALARPLTLAISGAIPFPNPIGLAPTE